MTVVRLADYVEHIPCNLPFPVEHIGDPSVLLDEPYVEVRSDRDPALGVAVACAIGIAMALGFVAGVIFRGML